MKTIGFGIVESLDQVSYFMLRKAKQSKNALMSSDFLVKFQLLIALVTSDRGDGTLVWNRCLEMDVIGQGTTAALT